MRSPAMLLAIGMLIACGGSGGGVSGGGGSGGGPADAGSAASTITIRGYAYSPTNLTVAPGTTITVVNLDSVSHSVTSESAAGQFTPGAVNGVSFDTGLFTGQHAFTVPNSAPSGTVIPYYCTSHKSMMATRGQITIQ